MKHGSAPAQEKQRRRLGALDREAEDQTQLQGGVGFTQLRTPGTSRLESDHKSTLDSEQARKNRGPS